MKIYTLLLSWPAEDLRRSFAACIDRAELAKITELKLGHLAGFLPEGVTGHDVDFEAVKKSWRPVAPAECKFVGNRPQVTLFNYNPAITAQLTAYFSRLGRRLPIEIIVKETPPADMAKIIFSRKPYAAIIGFDSSGSLAGSFDEASTYFESFFRKERLINTPLGNVEKNVKAAIEARAVAEKTQFYRLAHEEVLRSGYLVPLGRLMTEQYYPKWISNITWEDTLAGFPRVDRMRIIR